MKNAWEALDNDYFDMLVQCNDLNGDLCRNGTLGDECILKEIRNRMELIHYKAGVVKEFIKILQTAEDGNFDLGKEINAIVSFYYANFIIDLRIETEQDCPYYFADMKCFDFLEGWKKLCKRYKNYFVKKVTLPKGIDLTLYQLAK